MNYFQLSLLNNKLVKLTDDLFMINYMIIIRRDSNIQYLTSNIIDSFLLILLISPKPINLSTNE